MEEFKEMIMKKFKSVEDALYNLEELDKQREDVFDYIRCVMKEKATKTDSKNVEQSATDLKAFFDYANRKVITETLLPNFTE